MANQAAAVVDPTLELQTESLRLTGFLSPAEQAQDPTWWTDIAGTAPETRTSKPGRGELQEAGSVGDRTLTLSIQPGRVDWFLTPRFEHGTALETPWAGPYRDAVTSFSELMARWLSQSPSLIRLAFAVVVHRPVANKATGYRCLGKYLTCLQIDPNSDDLMYQINRPRTSSVVRDLKINRFSRWSVAQFMSLRLAVAGQTLQPNVEPGPFSCRIDLDLSTDGQRVEPLEHAMLQRLFDEMKTMSEELLVRGDVA
jgi:hypothetical protein